MVDQAFYTLPQLHAALRGEGGIHADLEGMQALADRIAAGEEAFYTRAGRRDVAAVEDVAVDVRRRSAWSSSSPSSPPAAQPEDGVPAQSSIRCCWKSWTSKSAGTW